ncbi:MAG: CHASE2 domain-containing protein [SAR324 cluster bacterium]|nr:CHASE2 domain-containing protein [SAR324 cluster bacterium]
MMNRFLKISPLKLALFITGSVLFIYSQRYEPLTFLDKKWTDFQQKYYTQVPQSDRIFIAAIDAKSVEHYGRWPWPRSRFSDLIRTLNEFYQVRTIGLDILFSEPEVNTDHDAVLGQTIAEAGNVILGYFIHSKSGLFQLDHTAMAQLEAGKVPAEVMAKLQLLTNRAPLKWPQFKALIQQKLTTSQYQQYWEILWLATHLHRWHELTPQQISVEQQTIGSSQIATVVGQRFLNEAPLIQGYAAEPSISLITRQAAGQGFLNAFQDSEDGVLRRSHLVQRLGDQLYTSVDVQILKHYLNANNVSVQLNETGIQNIGLGATSIPLYKDGSLLLNYKGPRETFPTISIYDIIEHHIPRETLHDRIALVGATEIGLLDSFVTPLGGDYPGIEFHATVLENILSETWLQRVPHERWQTFLLLIFIGVGLSLAAASYSYLVFSLIAWGGLGIALGSYSYLLHVKHTWYSVIYTILLFSGIWIAQTVYAFFKADAEKRQEQKLSQDIIYNAPISIFTTDLQGVVIAENTAARRLFKLQQNHSTLGEDWGAPDSIFHQNIDSPNLLQQILNGTQPEAHLTRVPYTSTLHQFSPLVVNIHIAPLKRGADLLGTIIQFEDITDMERALREKEAAQLAAFKQKETTERQMAGGFAHEMRNALVGAKLIVDKSLGYMGAKPYESLSYQSCVHLKKIYEVLASAESSELPHILSLMKNIYRNEEQIDKGLQLIHKSTSHALAITDQILNFAKLSKEEKGLQPIQMDQIILDVVEELRQTLEEHHITAQLNLAGNGHFQAHPHQLHLMLSHLLKNAIDALLERGGADLAIALKSWQRESVYTVTIADNGIGIDPAIQSRIFDAFFSTKPESGTGLGLSFVQKIVHLYEGSLEVHSGEPDETTGMKTTFTVHFPVTA